MTPRHLSFKVGRPKPKKNSKPVDNLGNQWIIWGQPDVLGPLMDCMGSVGRQTPFALNQLSLLS